MAGGDDRTSGALLALRLALAAVFVPAGLQKLGAMAEAQASFALVGIPFPGAMAWVVALAEVAAGLGLLAGVLPRLAGAGMALTMLVATALVTWPRMGFQGSRLELALLAMGLAIALAGAGRFTLPVLLGHPRWDVESALLGPPRAPARGRRRRRPSA